MSDFGLRDFLFIAVVFATCGVAVVRPFAGLMGFLIFSIVNPHSMVWSIASTFHPVQPIAGATIVGYLISSEPKRLPRQVETYLLLALWAAFGLSTLTAVYPNEAYTKLTHVSKILLMVFLSMALVNTQERLLQLVRVVALSLGFLGLKGGLFAIASGGQHMVWGPEKSFLEANNAIGLALAMNLPLLFYLRHLEHRRWLRHLETAMMLLSYPAIVCTFSRGAWLSAIAATGVMVWNRRQRWAVAVGLLVAAALIAPMLPDRVMNRYEELKNYEEETSAQTRFWTWEFCRRVGFANPLTGAGFDFPSERTYAQYYPEFLQWRERVASCHNMWLTVLGEHGFPGFLLFVSLLSVCFMGMRKIRRTARSDSDPMPAKTTADMVRAALVAYMVGGMFLDLAYFDIFYQLVAISAVLKTLVHHGAQDPHRAGGLLAPAIRHGESS
jgi:probable O-glycosylation ligase (exosortase A-associated)